MAQARTCESCGMPMEQAEDFGGGQADNRCCRYCCHEDGRLKSYEGVLEGFTHFIMSSQNIAEPEARAAASEALSQLPAWRARTSRGPAEP